MRIIGLDGSTRPAYDKRAVGDVAVHRTAASYEALVANRQWRYEIAIAPQKTVVAHLGAVFQPAVVVDKDNATADIAVLAHFCVTNVRKVRGFGVGANKTVFELYVVAYATVVAHNAVLPYMCKRTYSCVVAYTAVSNTACTHYSATADNRIDYVTVAFDNGVSFDNSIALEHCESLYCCAVLDDNLVIYKTVWVNSFHTIYYMHYCTNLATIIVISS